MDGEPRISGIDLLALWIFGVQIGLKRILIRIDEPEAAKIRWIDCVHFFLRCAPIALVEFQGRVITEPEGFGDLSSMSLSPCNRVPDCP